MVLIPKFCDQLFLLLISSSARAVISDSKKPIIIMKSDAATAHSHGGRGQSSFERLRRKLSFPPKTKKADSKEGSLSLPLVLKDETESSSGSDEELQKKVFNFFDENGDGRITAAELQSCLMTVGGGGELSISVADAEAAIQSSDLNGDGVLDFDEFLKLMEGNQEEEEEKNCELRDAFALYVMDGSNSITPASLKRMLTRLGLGESKSIDDCKAMIRPFDINGDGVLSFEEFSLMMH